MSITSGRRRSQLSFSGDLIKCESRCGPALRGSIIQGEKINPVSWGFRQAGGGASRRACRNDIREGFSEAASDQAVGPRRMEVGVSLMAWVGGSRRVVYPKPLP